jgi:hypothetical protein
MGGVAITCMTGHELAMFPVVFIHVMVLDAEAFKLH